MWNFTKRITCVLLMAAFLLTGLNACGTKEDRTLPVIHTSSAGTNTDSKETDEPGNTATVPAGTNTMVADRWVCSDSLRVDGKEILVDYRIPELLDHTEDAAAINARIADIYEGMHKRVQEALQTGNLLSADYEQDRLLYFTGYDCYQNGDVISLVIRDMPNPYDTFAAFYTVFNYDFRKGKEISNTELFSLKGISPEKFTEGIKRAAAYAFDLDIKNEIQYNMELKEAEESVEEQYMYDRYQLEFYSEMCRLRESALDDLSISPSLPAYLDESGELKACVLFPTMSLYGYKTEILSVIPWENHNLRANTEDMMEVVSEDDGIYFTIFKTERSEMLFSNVRLEFGKKYKLEGAYKNYIDVAISWVGNGMQPYIMLIADDGMVTYADVWEGLRTGTVVSVEPMMKPFDLVSFETPELAEMGVIAKDKNGEEINVDSELYLLIAGYYDNAEPSWDTYMSEDGGVLKLFVDGSFYIKLPEQEDSISGYLSYNPGGAILCVELYQPATNTYEEDQLGFIAFLDKETIQGGLDEYAWRVFVKQDEE